MKKEYYILSLFLILIISSMFGQTGQKGRDGNCMFSSENLFVENIATKIDTNGWIDFKPLGIFEKGDLFEKYKTEMGLSNDDEMLLVSSEDGNNNDQHN